MKDTKINILKDYVELDLLSLYCVQYNDLRLLTKVKSRGILSILSIT